MTEKRDFDTAAATWDEEPRRVKLAREVADAIVSAVRPTGEMDALDFGCGTGLLTLCLQPHLGSITGLDSSRGMLEALTRKIEAQGLPNVRTLLLDIERGELPTGQYHLIVSSMTLHHVADPGPLFRMFRGLLHPGGVICLADLDTEDGSFHDDPTGICHFGFDRAELMDTLAAAGFTELRAVTAAVIRKISPSLTRDYPVFLISGLRPAS